jgi:hypothetical protein
MSSWSNRRRCCQREKRLNGSRGVKKGVKVELVEEAFDELLVELGLFDFHPLDLLEPQREIRRCRAVLGIASEQVVGY